MLLQIIQTQLNDWCLKVGLLLKGKLLHIKIWSVCVCLCLVTCFFVCVLMNVVEDYTTVGYALIAEMLR